MYNYDEIDSSLSKITEDFNKLNEEKKSLEKLLQDNELIINDKLKDLKLENSMLKSQLSMLNNKTVTKENETKKNLNKKNSSTIVPSSQVDLSTNFDNDLTQLNKLKEKIKSLEIKMSRFEKEEDERNIKHTGNSYRNQN